QLVPLVLSLPGKYKVKCLTTKWFLKKIAFDYLPKKIINRPKKGFTVPISKWIKKSDLIQDFLTNRSHYDHDLLSYDYVKSLFDAHINNKEDNARHLWLVFVFNYWMSSQL
ncbi:MAG: asparagine synthase-related protein, partial [Planctomycetota bacterium]